jgi:hypothetical protein
LELQFGRLCQPRSSQIQNLFNDEEVVMKNWVRLFAVSAMLAQAPADASNVFLDVQQVTPGGSGFGAFIGTLNGVAVSGQMSGPGNHTVLFDVNSAVYGSTIDGSSPQFSDGSVFAASQNQADRVGYGNDLDTVYAASRLTINFGQTMSNLVFNIANLDGSIFDFTTTSGLTGISLLSGNGDGSEGLGVSGKSLFDYDPNTIIGQNPEDQPFTSDVRSAYGSVLLAGSYDALVIDIYTNPAMTAYQHSLDGIAQDGGSFTLSAPVPVPAAFWLFGSGLLVLLGRFGVAGKAA